MCQNLILIIVWLRKLCYTGGYIQVYRIRYNKNNCNKYAHNFIIIQISFISLFFKFFFLKSFRSYIDAIWASFLYYEGISVADQYSEKKVSVRIRISIYGRIQIQSEKQGSYSSKIKFFLSIFIVYTSYEAVEISTYILVYIINHNWYVCVCAKILPFLTFKYKVIPMYTFLNQN